MNRLEALEALAALPDRLEAWFQRIPENLLHRRPHPEEFAPLEHLWHLAELEEVFGLRLARLRDEVNPHLPDWRGDLAAERGRYLERDVAEGLARFRAARAANLAAFRALGDAQWPREGTQEGLGRLTLDELPGRMAAHDADHAAAFEERP